MALTNAKVATVNYLEEVNNRTMLWNIKVKVVLLWKQYYTNNPSKVASLDMILMDEKGKKINATIHNTLVPKFECLVQEGGLYMISNFEVIGHNFAVRLANHPSRISFHEETSVRSCTDYTCSVDVFEFVSIKDVSDQKIDKSLAFDVVGQVISNKDIRVMKINGQTRRILECELQNSSYEKVACALWDELAIKLHNYISENKEGTEPIVIVIQLAKFNMWRKKPQVSNCMFGSKVYINDDIPVITSFRESLKANKVNGGLMETEVKLSTNTIYTNPEDYFSNFSLKTINELIDIKEATGCVVIATIIKIKPEQGWYYLACRKCNGKAVETVKSHEQLEPNNPPAPFQCAKCKGVYDVYNRIKMQIEVQDSTGSDQESKSYPEELDMMLQKKCAFKIKISSFNIDKKYHSYTVDTASDDPDVINAVLEKSPHLQGKEKDTEEDDVLVISSTSNSAQDVPKLKIPKVEKD